MDITFYTNKSDKRYLNKRISTVKTINGALIKEESTIERPTVVLRGNNVPNQSQINYAYIPTYSRYYYITEITQRAGGIVEISMEVDVLMSFANQIRNVQCMIERQQVAYNDYYQDTLIPATTNKFIVYRKIGELPDYKMNVITVDGGAE